VPGATAQVLIDAEGEGLLKTKYLIRDVATGQILMVGDSESVTPKRMLIKLAPEFTSKLTPGALYELIVATYSEDAATISIARDFFDVLSLAPIEKEIESVSKELTDRLRTVSENLANAITALDSKLDKSTNTLAGEIKRNVEDVRARVDAATNTLSNNIRNLQSVAENTLLTAQIVMALAVIAIIVSIIAIIRRPTAPK
jgi:gas vesicle protein